MFKEKEGHLCPSGGGGVKACFVAGQASLAGGGPVCKARAEVRTPRLRGAGADFRIVGRGSDEIDFAAARRSPKKGLRSRPCRGLRPSVARALGLRAIELGHAIREGYVKGMFDDDTR